MSARKGQKRPRVSDESQEEDLHLSDDEGTYVDNIYIPPPIKRQNIQSSNTRLMITHITNHFFKSYAENVILGPFCKVSLAFMKGPLYQVICSVLMPLLGPMVVAKVT